MRGIVVYPELEPSRDRRVILRRLEGLSSAYRRVDIPDIPLGKPSISSPVLSVYARHALGVDVISHLRMIDHNLLSSKSIIKTLIYINIKKIIFLNGDPPKQGGACESRWTPEEAVGYARKYGAEPGLLLGPRRSLEEIRERIRVGARYYYITRVNFKYMKKIEKIIEYIRDAGAGAGLYVIIGTSANREYLESNGIPYVLLEDIPRLMEWAERVADIVILSAPGDGDSLLGSVLGVVEPWI